MSSGRKIQGATGTYAGEKLLWAGLGSGRGLGQGGETGKASWGATFKLRPNDYYNMVKGRGTAWREVASHTHNPTALSGKAGLNPGRPNADA